MSHIFVWSKCVCVVTLFVYVSHCFCMVTVFVCGHSVYVSHIFVWSHTFCMCHSLRVLCVFTVFVYAYGHILLVCLQRLYIISLCGYIVYGNILCVNSQCHEAVCGRRVAEDRQRPAGIPPATIWQRAHQPEQCIRVSLLTVRVLSVFPHDTLQNTTSINLSSALG